MSCPGKTTGGGTRLRRLNTKATGRTEGPGPERSKEDYAELV